MTMSRRTIRNMVKLRGLGFSQKEISDLLRVSQQSVSYQLKKLREQVSEYETPFELFSEVMGHHRTQKHRLDSQGWISNLLKDGKTKKYDSVVDNPEVFESLKLAADLSENISKNAQNLSSLCEQTLEMAINTNKEKSMKEANNYSSRPENDWRQIAHRDKMLEWEEESKNFPDSLLWDPNFGKGEGYERLWRNKRGVN